MCQTAKWCIVPTGKPCEVHSKYPNLQPLEEGPTSAAPDCSFADRDYLRWACPEEDFVVGRLTVNADGSVRSEMTGYDSGR
jgi:hypothetical protein